MSQQRIEADESGVFVYCGGLDNPDFMATEALAHDIKSAGQRGIPESPSGITRRGGPDDADE
jgi:hypothetical protein